MKCPVEESRSLVRPVTRLSASTLSDCAKIGLLDPGPLIWSERVFIDTCKFSSRNTRTRHLPRLEIHSQFMSLPAPLAFWHLQKLNSCSFHVISRFHFQKRPLPSATSRTDQLYLPHPCKLHLLSCPPVFPACNTCNTCNTCLLT